MVLLQIPDTVYSLVLVLHPRCTRIPSQAPLFISFTTPSSIAKFQASLSTSFLSHVKFAILSDSIMSTSQDRGGDYKPVSLDERDAVELRKAVATGGVKEPLISSASA